MLNWMTPRKFFPATCALSIAGLLGIFIPVPSVAVASFSIAGIGFANIFPLVFSITVETLPDRTNELSGLMVTAIVGGALLPPLMGFIADHASVELSFLVPLSALLYITLAAVVNLRPRELKYA